MTKVFHFKTDDEMFTCTGKDEAEARRDLDFLYVRAGYLTAGQAARAKVETDGIDHGTWEEFVAKHQPIRTPITEAAPYDGCMFETFGEELAMVRRHDLHSVFTLVEADGFEYVIAGYHVVNRMGYFIVKQPWGIEDLLLTYVT